MDLSDQELCVSLEGRTMFDGSDLFSSNCLRNIFCAVVSIEAISSFIVGSNSKITLVEMPSMFFLKDTGFYILDMCSYSNDALSELEGLLLMEAFLFSSKTAYNSPFCFI